MHSVAVLVLIASSICLAYKSESYGNNLIERDDGTEYEGSVLVECPVCLDTGRWLPSNEECPITLGKSNKRYKKCERGTYVNEVCGNRLDCYRGPGEKCTQKHEFDMLGQKCAPGYYCNKPLGMCTGREFAIDSNVQWLINSHPYQHDPRGLYKGRDNTKINFDAIRD